MARDHSFGLVKQPVDFAYGTQAISIKVDRRFARIRPLIRIPDDSPIDLDPARKDGLAGSAP